LAGLVLLVLGAAGGRPTARVRAAEAPAGPGAEVRDLAVDDLRGRLRLLDEEHNGALADEDYDKAARILREINRLEDELLRRHLAVPPARPPDADSQRP
jgi:hypothetical protein